MGTRATVQIQVNEVPLLTIYRQYDGYLDAMGREILSQITKENVNGYSDSKAQFNGPTNLCAMLVCVLNKSNITKNDVECGNVYIQDHPEHTNQYNDYRYTINFENPLAKPLIKVDSYGEITNWMTVEEFSEHIEKEYLED
jgi:hypothetical protein